MLIYFPWGLYVTRRTRKELIRRAIAVGYKNKFPKSPKTELGRPGFKNRVKNWYQGLLSKENPNGIPKDDERLQSP
jgi:hypothetical protein